MQAPNRNIGIRHETKWVRGVTLAIAWLIIISLARDVWQVRVGFGRITESEQRLSAEVAKNVSLKGKLGLLATDDYREKLIREKLNMQKEGEIIVVMPNKESGSVEKIDLGMSLIPNWVRWWNLVK